MIRAMTFTSSTALGLVLFATQAAADLTASDVWGDWRSYMEGLGYTVSAVEETSGNTLSLTDITVDIAGGPEVDKMTLSVSSLQFVENSDGTVDMVVPDTLPITMRAEPKSTGEPATVVITYTQTGHKITASGTPQAMRYDYTADSFAMALTDMTVDGTTAGADVAQFNVTGENLVSSTDVTVGDVRSYDQNVAAANVTYDLFFKSPDGPETIAMGSTAANLSFEGTSAVPVTKIADASNVAALLDAGFAFDGTFGTTGTESTVEVTGPDGPTKIKTGSSNASFGVAMGTDGIRYDVAAQTVQIGAQIAGLPVPLYLEMAETGFALTAPLAKAEAPQDFALSFNLTDFSMSDVIWGMFDPSGQLPRDPATVALDVTGKAKMLFDLLDPAVAARMTPGTQPAEIETLKINDLTVNAVGAQIDATGDIAFDNSDKATLPGVPKPVGEININLAGASALIDKLVGMGLLPEDQAMGARMMMGLFAVPGATPDTLTSKIEFNEAGQILANGQRIK